MDDLPYTIIHRGEGVLIVRVHSTDSEGAPLPDAVFTFRPGEPQYESWRRIYNESNPEDQISMEHPAHSGSSSVALHL